jgi:hypothetical protein
MLNCLILKKSDNPIVKEGQPSPLGWSAGVRLIRVTAALAILRITVARAICW